MTSWQRANHPNEMVQLGVRNGKLFLHRGRNFWYLMQRLTLSSDIYFTVTECACLQGVMLSVLRRMV